MNARKLTPKIMKIVSKSLNKNIKPKAYFKILGLVYNIEEEIEKSKER